MPLSLTTEVAQAITARAYGYDVLIEAPAISLRLAWFYSPDSSWERRLLRIDAVETGVPPGGGVGFVSQLTFSMVDDGTGQGILANEEAIVFGAAITLKLLFAGEDYADAVVLFTGSITGWELYDGECQLTATDDRLVRNLLLPQTVVTLATHPNAPEQSIGQALPIVYGRGNTLDPIPLLLIDAVNTVYQVSEHENGQMLAVFGAWPPGTDRLKIVEATAAQATILGTNRLQLLQRLTETRFGVNTAAPTIADTDGIVLNEANLLDNDPNSITSITTQDASGIGRVELDFIHPDPVGINTIDVALLQHRRNSAGAVTVHGSFVLDSRRQDGTTAIQGIFASMERRVSTTPQDERFRVSGISLEDGHILRMTVSAINETGAAGGANDAYEVGQVDVLASYLVSGPFEPIYLPDVEVSAEGIVEGGILEEGIVEEGSTVTFLGRTDDDVGTITGTPGGGLSNPVDVITSILLYEKGLTVDPLTTPAARSARTDWRFAGGLGAGWFRARTTALDFLHSLCLQAGCYLYPQGNGTFVIKPINALGGATFAIGPAGSATDYLLYERNDPGSGGTTWRRTMRYRGGRSENIRNAFEIRYGFHSARQQFVRIAQASHLGTSDTQGRITADTIDQLQVSQSRYGSREPYLLDADFIYHHDTAYALLNLLIPYWLSPRQEVEFETTMAPLAVQLGETITVDTEGMPASMRQQVFEVDRIRYDFEQGRIFLHGTQRSLFTLDYFRIRDQAGTIWYVWLDGITEQLVRSLTPPNIGNAVLRDITPATIPYWWAIVDPTAVTRYVLPTALGQILVQSTIPAVGTGFVGSPTWMTLRGVPYHLETTPFQQFTVIEGVAP